MEFLDAPWGAGLTGWQWIGIAVAASVVLSLLKTIFFRRKQRESHLVAARCENCNWSGNTSKLSRQCPRCNNPL